MLVTNSSDLIELVNSESRVMLLYATSDEANFILKAANEYKIIGENYVWVVTQSVIENLQTPLQYPVGMLGEFCFYIFSSRRGSRGVRPPLSSFHGTSIDTGPDRLLLLGGTKEENFLSLFRKE